MFQESDLISSYTRRNALDDGLLIDDPIDSLAKQIGYKYHVAMTSSLRAALDPTKTEREWGQTLNSRVWDMLMVSIMAIKRKQAINGDLLSFVIDVAREHERSMRIVQQAIKLRIGPGDDPTPVLTFMLPEED